MTERLTPAEMHEFLEMRAWLRDHPVIKVHIEHEAAPEWNAVQLAPSWAERDRLDVIRCRKVLDLYRQARLEVEKELTDD